MPEVRVVELADRLGALFYQHALFEVEQVRRLFAGLLPPAVEVAGGNHIVADALVVKLEQRFIVHQNVAAAGLVLKFLHFRAQLQVFAEEGVARLPVTLHQRVTDKQLAAERRIDLAVVDLARGDHRQAVNGHFFGRHHRALRALPVRFTVRALEQMLRHRLHPFRIDTGGNASPQAAGFHQFRDHGPLRRLLEQARTREDGETGVARAGILLLLGVLHPNVGQQAGQQRDMNFAVLRRFAVHRNAQLFHHLPKLGIDILPLAHAQVVEEIHPALAAELVRRERLLLLAEVVPQVHEGEEIGLFVVEAAVLFVRGLLFVHRTLARILNGERRGNDHCLAHAAVLLRFQHHARQTRVDRELAELAAQRRQLIDRRLLVGGNRPELFQQTHAVLNVALIRRFDERKRRDVAQPQGGHLQDNGRQVGAQNFRVGKLRARQEIVFGVETNADPFRHAAAAALTLVGRRLRNGLNRQPLDLGAVAVAADARRTRVDHVFDARHGERGFRHVGRQDDAASAVRLEDAVLFAVGQAGIQRQDLGVAQVALAERIGGIADFAFAAHEDQDVARAFVTQLVNGIKNSLQLVALGIIRLFHNRAIAHFHGIRASRHLNNRRIVEVLRETFRVDGRGGDDHFQIRATRQQLFQVAEQEVDVQAALVRFVNDDGVVLHQQAILLNFRQQNTVGHQLDHGVIAHVVAESHLVADAAARLRLQLFGNTVGNGARRQTTRLGMANQAFYPAAQLHTDFRQLGGFPRTGFTRDNHHLVVAYGLKNVLFLLADGQVFRVGNCRARSFAQHNLPCRLFNLFRHLLVNGLLSIRIFNLLDAVQTAGKALFTAQRQRIELLQEHREGEFLLFCHSVKGQYTP